MGHRWKEYHEALGLKSIVDFSWEMVQKEKEDMLHVLDFPYNGETLPKYIMGDGKITQNKHHLCASSYTYLGAIGLTLQYSASETTAECQTLTLILSSWRLAGW